MRTPVRPARLRTAAQGFFRSVRGWPGFAPWITKLPVRGSTLSTSIAAVLKTRVFRPVLLSGKNASPRSRSTSGQRRCRISRSRAPVRRSRRTLRRPKGQSKFVGSLICEMFDVSLLSSTFHGSPTVSASRSAAPTRLSSSVVRYRSRPCSRYFSTREQDCTLRERGSASRGRSTDFQSPQARGWLGKGPTAS